jgi:hypothetical protein
VRGRGSRWAPILAGGVVVAAGFGIALVEAYRWPKGSIWLVAGGAVLLVLLIRLLARRQG